MTSKLISSIAIQPSKQWTALASTCGKAKPWELWRIRLRQDYDALSLLRLVPPPAGRIVGGEIRLNGDDLLQKSDEEMRQIRGRQISMILQDPQTSLNPVFTIGNQLMEALGMARREGRKNMLTRRLKRYGTLTLRPRSGGWMISRTR